MTAPGPEQPQGSSATVAITTNGAALDSSWQVVSIDIWSGVNAISRARLAIADGDAASQTFPISETNALIPGAMLTISLGYGGANALVFSGIVHRQGLAIGSNGAPLLIVEATDPAMAMTLARANAVFDRATDSDVMAMLISKAGLKAAVTATQNVEEAIVQYCTSDWDFVLARAAVNGMVVTMANGTVTVALPDTGQAPVLAITYGESILDFRADMDASTQYAASAVQSFAWDPSTQAVAQSGAASTAVTGPGNISSDTLAKVFGVAPLLQQTAGTLGTADLTTWSSARLTQAELARICGACTYRGSALAGPGSMIALGGLGDRFNGNAYVSAVHHHVAEGEWTTEASIGLAPDWLADAASPSAAGQIPAAPNLQTGIVQRIDQDPVGEFRVLVSLPLLQASSGIWARLGGFYASAGAGMVFYPEIGDEVVIAFMNGDPRFAVIVGSLYSTKRTPPVPPDATNSRKSIVTRAGLRIDFVEKDNAVEISTPGKQSVRLDDKAKAVTLADCSGNKIALAQDGITITSAAAIALDARTEIVVATTQGKVSLNGTAGISLSGLLIDARAQTTFSAAGAAEASLIAGGMVTVQGGMVKIN